MSTTATDGIVARSLPPNSELSAIPGPCLSQRLRIRMLAGIEFTIQAVAASRQAAEEVLWCAGAEPLRDSVRESPADVTNVLCADQPLTRNSLQDLIVHHAFLQRIQSANPVLR